jgi:hypothetical protein
MQCRLRQLCMGLLVPGLLLSAGCVGIPMGPVNKRTETASEVSDPKFPANYSLHTVEASPFKVVVRLTKTTRGNREVECRDVVNKRYLAIGLFPGFYHEIFLKETSSGSMALDYLRCIGVNLYSVGLATIFHWIAEPHRDWKASKADRLSLIGFDKTGVRDTVQETKKVAAYSKTVPVEGIDVVLTLEPFGKTLKCRTDAEGCVVFTSEGLAFPDNGAIAGTLTAMISGDVEKQVRTQIMLRNSPPAAGPPETPSTPSSQ